MNDSEFFELLNLYLDHEISTVDAGRLEREVQSNPERRRIYQEYCRMQKACTMLAKDFVTPEVTPGEQKVVAFGPQPSWKPGVLTGAGLLAAAACVALIMVNRSAVVVPPSAGAASLVVQDRGTGFQTGMSVDAKLVDGSDNDFSRGATISRTVTIPVTLRSELPQTAVVARGLVLSTNFAFSQQAENNPSSSQLDWISGLQIAPMPQAKLDDLRFEVRPAAGSQNSVFHSGKRPAQQGIVEMTAFQFQK
jgi:hypothetical protein